MAIFETLFPPPSEYSAEQRALLRSNISNHIMDGSMYVFGMSMVAVQTILPVFIQEMGGGPLAIGSVQVIWSLGANVPGAFVARFLRRREYFRPPMVRYGFIHRFLLLVAALATATLVGRLEPSFIVPFFLLLIFLIAAFGSIGGLPWFQIYTKTVPVILRGRLMGVRQLIGSAFGVVGGWIVAFVLAAAAFPYNYAVLFTLAFVLTMISFSFLLRVREMPTVQTSTPDSIDIVSEAKAIIRGNRNFRHYLVADAFLLMTFGSISFYAVYGLQRFSLAPAAAGTFTAVMMVSNIVANLAFGFIGDAYGHRANMLALAGCMGLAAVTAMLSPNVFLYGFVFFFIGCALQIVNISRLPLIAEMCSESERPVYIGVTNTLTAPALLVGILFGWIVRRIGYESIFLLTALVAAVAFYLLSKYVTEPRAAKPSAG